MTAAHADGRDFGKRKSAECFTRNSFPDEPALQEWRALSEDEGPRDGRVHRQPAYSCHSTESRIGERSALRSPGTGSIETDKCVPVPDLRATSHFVNSSFAHPKATATIRRHACVLIG